MLAADAEPAFAAGDGAARNATFAWRWLAGEPVAEWLELVPCRKCAVEELLEECGFGATFAFRVDSEDVRCAVGEAGEQHVVPVLVGAGAAANAFVIGGEIDGNLRLCKRAAEVGRGWHVWHAWHKRHGGPARIASPRECL